MKRFLTLILLGSLMVALSVLSSCTKDYFVPFPVPDVISYANDIQPFFDAKCISCHGPTPPNLEAAKSYDNLFQGNFIDTLNPSNSLLFTKIDVGGSMAIFANSEERAMTLKWIEQGAKNN